MFKFLYFSSESFIPTKQSKIEIISMDVTQNDDNKIIINSILKTSSTYHIIIFIIIISVSILSNLLYLIYN